MPVGCCILSGLDISERTTAADDDGDDHFVLHPEHLLLIHIGRCSTTKLVGPLCCYIFRFSVSYCKQIKLHNISNRVKVRLYGTFVVSVLVYGSECWCLKQEDERRILSAGMAWLRRLLCVTRRDRIRNDTVRNIYSKKSHCSEDKEATTHVVRAHDKTEGDSVTLSYRMRKKSGSTTNTCIIKRHTVDMLTHADHANPVLEL